MKPIHAAIGLIAVAFGAAAALSSFKGGEALPEPTSSGGVYVEARDATVWGGACHISSQARTGGRNLVQAFGFDDGTRAVLVTAGADNLDAHRVFHGGEPASRESVLFVSPGTDPAAARSRVAELMSGAQRTAALRAELRSAGIDFDSMGDSFRVAIDGLLEISGEALADRACCTMPESRWYAPLARIEGSVVANPDVCRFEGEALTGLDPWTFTGENSAYVGTF